MSEIFDEGLTMEQASPDLNEGDPTTEGTEVIDSSPDTPAETADNRSETKKVSDRINQIRAENEARMASLQEQLESKDRELLAYRAKEEGVTVDELAARENAEREAFKNALHNDPEFIALQQRDFERQKSEVLTQLQTEFPKDGIDNLDVLPQDFFRMLQAGVSPVTAYRASVADAQKETPPTSGSVKSKGEATSTDNINEDTAMSMSIDEWKEWLNANER